MSLETVEEFLHSVASKLPILQESPSALQVATWLDITVKIFRSDLPEAGASHLANMLTGKIPQETWDFLVQEGLTSSQSSVSFETLTETLFRCICGPSFVQQLEDAYTDLEQGAVERPSDFLYRLTNLHQYFLQLGYGRITSQLVEVITLVQKSNAITAKFLRKHLIDMQDSQQVVSLDSCKAFLAKNEAAIARKYDQQRQDTHAENPCDINYTGNHRSSGRRYENRAASAFRGHPKRRGHWSPGPAFQRRFSYQGRRPLSYNGQRQRPRRGKYNNRRHPRNYSQQAVAVTDKAPQADTSFNVLGYATSYSHLLSSR